MSKVLGDSRHIKNLLFVGSRSKPAFSISRTVLEANEFCSRGSAVLQGGLSSIPRIEDKLPEWLRTLNPSVAQREDQALGWEIDGPGSGTSLETNTHIVMKRDPEEPKAPSRIALLVRYGTELAMDQAEAVLDTYNLGQDQG